MAAALEQLGAPVVQVDLGDALAPAALTIEGAAARGPAQEGWRAAFVDLLPLAVPRAFVAGERYWLYDDWYRDFMEARDRRALLEAWLLRLEAGGVVLCNAPGNVLAHDKPAQLAALAAARLPVPPFLMTSDPVAARRFLGRHRDAVVKPVLGGGLCVAVGREQLAALGELRRAPAIVQARVRGADVRVTAVAGRVLSAVSIDADEDHVDFRASPAYQRGVTRYRPLRLDAASERVCLAAMKLLGMRLAGIDLKRDSSGRLWLLECNSQPGWLAIEAATGTPIAQGIATYLLGLAGLRPGKMKPAPRRRASTARAALVRHAPPRPPSQRL